MVATPPTSIAPAARIRGLRVFRVEGLRFKGLGFRVPVKGICKGYYKGTVGVLGFEDL